MTWLCWIRQAIGVAILTMVVHAACLAQGPGAAGSQRFLQEQLRPLIQPDLTTPAPADRLLLDYGAILRSTTAWFEDPGIAPNREFQNSRALHIAETRPWARMTYGGIHRGYVRGQFSYLNYYKGDHYDFSGNHDWQGPYLDLGFYQFDVDEAVRRWTGESVQGWSADATVGRQFLYVGRGIAFGLNTDAVSLDWAWNNWAGLVYGSQSVQRGNDLFDNRSGVYQLSDRGFFGAQIEYQGWDRRDLYGYVVSQWDTSDSSSGPDEYDCEYWGIGSTGEVLFGDPADPRGIPNLQYFTEFVVQRGQSATIFSREEIRSWAFDAGLNYYWNAPCRPRLTFEYARASGDPTRIAQPQRISDGNLPETSDTTFLGFGYLNTGASFAPLFANLEFVRFGAAARPFADACSRSWQNFEVGTNAFVYWRPESAAAISDARADIAGDHFLGHEWDLFVNWQMSSDLFLLVNYGVFFPNDDSFSPGNDRSRQFLTVNLNWLL